MPAYGRETSRRPPHLLPPPHRLAPPHRLPAQAKGWYQDAGLDVQLLSTHHDSYKRTPASRVADGTALFAVTPSETVVSSHTFPTRHPLVAVAALQAKTTSAIVTLKSSGLSSPKDLDGRTYASYGARYEGRIVQELIKRSGGSGEYTETVLPMLGIWDTLLAGKADSTWIFLGWEGVEASLRGVELNIFKLADAGIPYGYSPLLVADPARLAADPETAKAFLSATARGFAFAAERPEEAGRMLYDLAVAENPDMPSPLELELCVAATTYLAKEGAWGSPWGHMELSRWSSFVDWLHSSGLLTSAMQSRSPDGKATVSLDDLRGGKAGELLPPLDAAALFTNAYLA